METEGEEKIGTVLCINRNYTLLVFIVTKLNIFATFSATTKNSDRKHYTVSGVWCDCTLSSLLPFPSLPSAISESEDFKLGSLSSVGFQSQGLTPSSAEYKVPDPSQTIKIYLSMTFCYFV